MTIEAKREHGIYIVTGVAGVIVEGQRLCPFCAFFEKRHAWMQHFCFGELGGFWQCLFLGKNEVGSFIGGCEFCFPDYFSDEAIEGLAQERELFLLNSRADSEKDAKK